MKIPRFLPAFLFCLFLATSPGSPLFPSPAAAEEGFLSGAAAIDITPDQWPVALRGGFTPKPATEAHDPLTARAIAFQNGGGRAVIATIDAVGISRETCDAMKDLAAQATGWDPANILIAATHSHSAPSPSKGSSNPVEQAYQERALNGMVEAIKTAIGNLKPAAAGWGRDEVPEEVFNRRYYLKEGTMPLNPFGEMDQVKMNPSHRDIEKAAGPVDPQVSVLDIRARKGNQPLAFIGNYPLHYVGATSGQVSADYFGEYARLMPSRVRNAPGSFVAMLTNGTSGDINNIDFYDNRPPREPFEQIRLVAAKVADASWRATRDIDYHPDATVAMLQREVTLHYRLPSEEQIQRAKEILALTEKDQEKLPRLAAIYANRTLNQAENPETVDVIVQAIRVGDQAIVSMPFEVLVEIGLEIKEKSPFPHTFIIELANGSYGYLPPPRQHELGGYETWLGTNKVAKDSSEILTRNLLEMLAELHGG